VPELGGDVGIRRLSATDLIHIRSIAARAPANVSDDDNLNVLCEVLAMGLTCDDQGTPAFSPEELRAWDGTQLPLMERLVEAIQHHNGIGQAAEEELRKNSESGKTSVST